MEFKDLNIKNRYRSADTSNIGRDFIEKVLKHSVSYKRAVGFFSVFIVNLHFQRTLTGGGSL